MKYPLVKITKEDLKRIIYFILMKFRTDPLHMQGTSSKRDFLGGYIERWFNKAAETLIFDELLKDKNYNVVSDYFLYGNDSDKNAPDVLGLKTNDKKIIPFVQYNNGTWEQCGSMPRIEVKVIRKDQALLGIREPQMIDDYYVFVESNLEEDYLNVIFEDNIFNKKYLEELKNSSEFVKSDSDNQLIPHSLMSKNAEIGTMRLLGIYKKSEIRDKFVMCASGVKPYYFGCTTDDFHKKLDDKPVIEKIKIENGLCLYNYDNEVYLPFLVDCACDSIDVLIKNKGSFYFEAKENMTLCGNVIKPGYIKVEFKKFDRTSKWDENIALKSFIEDKGCDSTDELVAMFDKIVKK